MRVIFRGMFENFPRDGGIPWTKESLIYDGFHRTPSFHRFHRSIGGKVYIPSSQQTMESLPLNEEKFDIIFLAKRG